MIRARALARRLSALEEGPMRTRAAARALAAEQPAAAARLLADAVALAGQGESVLAAALGEALLAPGPDLVYDHLAAVYAAAVADGCEEVRDLLVAPAPAAGTRSRAIARIPVWRTSRSDTRRRWRVATVIPTSSRAWPPRASRRSSGSSFAILGSPRSWRSGSPRGGPVGRRRFDACTRTAAGAASPRSRAPSRRTLSRSRSSWQSSSRGSARDSSPPSGKTDRCTLSCERSR